MTIETTVLDFKLSNTFEEYETHMNAPEQQAMFKEMGVKTFFVLSSTASAHDSARSLERNVFDLGPT